MISVKYALIMAVGAFAAGSFFTSPVPQAIASTIANDVVCTGCVGTSDLAGNAVTAAKIKDSEVKAAEIAASAVGSSEIATDAVRADELAGVSKLVFTSCTVDMFNGIPATATIYYNCSVPAAATGDIVVATITEDNGGSGILLKHVSLVSSGLLQFGFYNTSTLEVPDGHDVVMGLVIFRN